MKLLLKISSIILIILSVLIYILSIIIGIKGQFMINELLKYSDDFKEIMSQLPAEASSSIVMILVISSVIAGTLYLLSGIFGLKGANGKNGLLLAGIVMMGITTILSAFSFSIFSIILGVLYLVGGIATYMNNRTTSEPRLS